MKKTRKLNLKQIIICSHLWPEHFKTLEDLGNLTGVNYKTLSRYMIDYDDYKANLSEKEKVVAAEVDKMTLDDMIAEVRGTIEDPEKVLNDLINSGNWKGF